jgi:transcriptional regulator with XRE-family HTH domain
MILADKIIDLRKKSGMSQEELAQKLGISRQSVSKWEAARSVPDMDKVLKLSDLFDVSCDYLLRDDLGPEDASGQSVSPSSATPDMSAVGEIEREPIPVTVEQANSFLDHEIRRAMKIATGVGLCVASAAPLMLFLGLYTRDNNVASSLGTVIIIALVALGIAVMVMAQQGDQEFQKIRHESIDTEYGVDGIVRQRQKSYDRTHMRELALGIVLCVASCIPLLAVAMLTNDEGPITASVGILLLIVAIGVFLIVHTSIISSSFSALLEEGDYTRGSKRFDKRFGNLYWGIVTAAYLLVSFLTRDWGMTWVVWPVAGVIWGAISETYRSR